MSDPCFPDVEPIAFEGPESRNPLAYRYYDAGRVVAGRPLRDQLRVAVCYWHSFVWDGSDTFGSGTFQRAWQRGGAPIEAAEHRTRAAFEFFEKLGVPFFTFHDRDVAPEGDTFAESDANLARMLDRIEGEMERTGVGCLWGTANLFGHPRYAAGAATNPDPEVFAWAAAQVRSALEATQRLGGANYVLWGGREGYDTLLHTDLRREAEQLARFLHLVAEHKHKIGFRGTLLIEPKPMEPTKHQYDFDAAAVHAFLLRHGLEKEFRLNLEVNHATLAGHSFLHEISYALANDLFGSVDINRGDPQLGWDTDQFPNDAREAALALYALLRGGGLGSGGMNFDAKLRRQSVDPVDLFHAHVGGIDTLARGCLAAARLLDDGPLEAALRERYADWDGPLGRRILDGTRSLADLAEHARGAGAGPRPRSGRQEALENLVNRYV